jgi:SAM-dependent methyltransferase
VEQQLLNRIAQRSWQVLFRTRSALNRELQQFAASFHAARILELGSGRRVSGDFPYSAQKFFAPTNQVILSDVEASYGHLIVDCTTMEFDCEFDGIICANVLEHVYDFEAAISRIHRALRHGGRAFIAVPVFFPLHDEPRDYWRFTEHSLRRLLSEFSEVELRHRGIRRAPLAYYATVAKR